MKTKLQKLLKYFAGAAFIFALSLNVIVTLDDPFLFMNDVAIATGGTGTGTTYKWSNDIDCPGLGNGNYQVCQVNGYQGTCTSAGAVTCNCGSSTNYNDDGNCD